MPSPCNSQEEGRHGLLYVNQTSLAACKLKIQIAGLHIDLCFDSRHLRGSWKVPVVLLLLLYPPAFLPDTTVTQYCCCCCGTSIDSVLERISPGSVLGQVSPEETRGVKSKAVLLYSVSFFQTCAALPQMEDRISKVPVVLYSGTSVLRSIIQDPPETTQEGAMISHVPGVTSP